MRCVAFYLGSDLNYLELFLQYFPDQFVRRLILLFTANPLGKNAINTTRTHGKRRPSCLGASFKGIRTHTRSMGAHCLCASALKRCCRPSPSLLPPSKQRQTQRKRTRTRISLRSQYALVCLCFEYYTQQRLAMPSMMLRRRGCCCGATSQSKAAQRSAAVPRLCSPCLTRSMRGLDARARAQYTFASNMYIVNAHSEWRWWWQIGMRAGRGMVYVRKAHKFKRGNSRRKRFCNQCGGESREIHTHAHTL